MEGDARIDNEDQESVVLSPEEISKKRKVVASPTSGEKKSQGNKRVRGIDEQAEESGDEDEGGNSDGDGSGNEDEDESNYVYNDNFLVHDDVGSDDSGGSRDRTRVKAKKKSLKSLKKQKGTLHLDDDDLLLVRDAMENSNKSSNKASSSVKARTEDRADNEIAPIEGRPRTTHDSDGEDDGEEEDGGDGAGLHSSNSKGRRPPQSSYYNDDDEGSDMGGFIVDEDSDEGEQDGDGSGGGKAVRHVSREAMGRVPHPHQITHRRVGRSDKPTFDQIQDAEDIFGAGFDDFSDEGEGEADDSDAEGALDGRVTTDKLFKMNMNKDGEYLENLGGEQIELSRKDKKRIQTLRSRYERSTIVATFCTERDDVLRRVDRPERLQEVLVGRDTPQEEERVLEAKWMAAKLAARLVADDHLNSDRASVPHTANPVAAQKSDLYFMSSDEEKEQRLKEELEEPILHVLRFLQVEQWEVPFIWNYRRDYLHPLMTREHLWAIFEYEEGWDTVVATKMRLSDEVSAIQDASQVSTGRNAAQSDAAQLSRLQSDLRRLNSALESLHSDVRLAEAEEKEAMDLVDEKEDPTPEDRSRVAAASAELESLQEQSQTLTAQLQEARAEEVQQLARLQRRSQFRPSAAKEVMRLFPVDRYLSIVRDTTDDTELRDVLRFFRLLAQNAEVGGSNGEGEEDGDGAEGEGEGTQDPETEAADGNSSSSAVKSRKFVKKGLRQHKDEYAKYKDLPAVRRVVEVVGVPASAFGDALRHGFKVEPPPTSELTSSLLAQQLLAETNNSSSGSSSGKANFKSEQQLLRAARMVLATELSMEPTVRGAARAVFKRLATVSTRPTPKGTSVITPFSEYFGLHFLHRKPLLDFYAGPARTLFVRLVEAERLGLITVSIDLPHRQERVEKKAADGTVTVETVDAPDHSPFITGELKLMQQFMPVLIVDEDMFPDSRLSWDTERLLCLNVCVEQLLCPSLQKEFRRDLIRLGKEAIVLEAARNFSKTLSVGPYVPPYQDDRERVKDLLKACPNRPFYGSVASIYISLGRDEPLCLAFVNRDGVLRAHDLVPAQAMNQKNDRIRKFLVDNRPDLIVLNASGASATRSTCILVEKNILKEVEEEIKRRDAARRDGRMEGMNYADDDEEEEFVPYRPQVMIVKDELARIFQSSDRRKKLFPELQPAEAAAVCLARYAQEPLAEYCSAWNAASSNETFGYELLFLPVHPLKSLLKGAQQALLNALECRLVDAVCDVGVDINKACSYDHIAPMLAFVGGLGLRKADALRQNIRKSAKAITSRNDLLLRKLLGSCVWTNAAGFVRICDNVTDPLDNTRIHPECYTTHDFATKICADALEVAHSNSDYVANVEKLMASTRRVLEKRMDKHRTWLDLWERGQRPIHGVTEYNETVRTVDGREHPLGVELGDILSQLELDDYAVELQESGQGKRRLLFEQIKDELRFPWLDLRLPLTAVTPAEMFFLLTGENDQSLYVGMKVGGTVTEISDTSFRDENTDQYKRRQRATVQTDAGLRGYIGMYDVEDTPQYGRLDLENMNLSDHVRVGQHIQAVVVAVKKDRLQLDLSIKPSFVNKPESWWMEQRCEVKQARDWWAMQGKDPSKIFDPYFLERQALRACADEEVSQQKSTESINQQLTAASINGVRSGAGTGGGGGANGAAGGRSLMRVVHHPLFANLDFKAAEERMRLEGKGAGEVLIRPSSKGPNFLTITWAFQDNWYKHISVEEKGKRAGDLGLGTQLLVQEDDIHEAYNDLDELFSRYIEPMNDLVSVMIKHRSFLPGSEADVNAMMFARRTDSPQRIPYFFRFEPNKPGVFTLTWLSLNIKSENPVKNLRVEVRPYGLRAQGEIFARPSELIVWFKETQATQAAAAAQLASKHKAARSSVSASSATSAAAVLSANANNQHHHPQQASYGAPPPPPPPVAPTVRKSRWEQA